MQTMRKKKRPVSGSAATGMEKLARIQAGGKVQHLAIPHLPEHDLYAKRKKHRVDYKDSLEDISPAIQNQTLQQEDTLRLQQAIRKLTETDRAIVSMNLDGYENAEVGEMLGISTNHVAVKLHRIKQQLANHLTQ